MRTRMILVAGVGNVLHGDDGFGVELAWRLARRPLPDGVKVIETGIGGMAMVQELMLGYDGLLLLDAHRAGAPPGTLRLVEPVLPDLSALDAHALRDWFADSHYATPMRALSLLERIGSLPPRVAVIGCEPQVAAPMRLGLSGPVAQALAAAEEMAAGWLAWAAAG